MNLKFNKVYFIVFLMLLAIEVIIAAFLKDGFIRHTLGDYLVVILMYCFFKSFIPAKPFYIATTVLVIAFVIEFLQLYELLSVLELQDNRIAKLVLGSTFHYGDLMAYTLGIMSVLLIEYYIQLKVKKI
ncbi:DUF2809 domain-containing protein [Geojedonia litorea]|uniref:DUF2809 domain-containing protein n=1 Tax=Geojedonia litorea TaxID=1268269 RepID=A0ABV9MZV5_9FLAO